MQDPTPHPNPEGRFSPQVEQVLRESGWYPGRSVPMEQLEQWLLLELWTRPGHHYQLRMFSAAFRILREFGGLVIQQDGPGVTVCRETLRFDPVLAAQQIQSYNWPLAEWEADGALFPIGYYGNGTTADTPVVVDGRGRISNEDYETLWGNTIEEALEGIIIGYMPPLMEKDRAKCHEASYMFPMMRKPLGVE